MTAPDTGTSLADTPLILPAPAPQRLEVITIRRPGFADIRLRFHHLAPGLVPSPGWLYLYGEVLEGLVRDHGWEWRTLYARPVERGLYCMVGRTQ